MFSGDKEPGGTITLSLCPMTAHPERRLHTHLEPQYLWIKANPGNNFRLPGLVPSRAYACSPTGLSIFPHFI